MLRGRLGVLAPAVAGLLGALAAGACGDKSLEERREEDRARMESRLGDIPDSKRPMTEAEKIGRLIDLVRTSGHIFVRNGKEHTSQEAAEHLKMKLERAGDRVHTAEDFIGAVATRSTLTHGSYHLRMADGTEVETRDWLLDRLRELEAPRAPSGPEATATAGTDGAAAPTGPTAAVPVDVDYALQRIETSGLTFLAPRKGDTPVVYTAAEFSRMLRRKATWLGPDLEGLQPWLDEIATRSFKGDLAYEVKLENGEVVDLRPWLDAQLAAARVQNQEGDG